jgi:hypothetical protein
MRIRYLCDSEALRQRRHICRQFTHVVGEECRFRKYRTRNFPKTQTEVILCDVEALSD